MAYSTNSPYSSKVFEKHLEFSEKLVVFPLICLFLLEYIYNYNYISITK